MLVKDLVNAIADKEVRVVEIAKQYSTSDRTIQTKIKKLGFVWDAKEARYNFIGTDKTVFDLDIDDVFKIKIPSRNKSTSQSKTTVKSEFKKASNELVETLQDITQSTSQTTPEVTSNKTSKKTSKINDNNTSDNIDRLLSGKKAKKAYRGFYFDSDLLAVIDSVGSGVKSELINECLRKVFKDKGLL